MKNNKSKELMQKFSIFFVLLVLIIVSSVMNPNFLSHRNITNIAVQLAVATILAYGEMVLIVSGLLDLSSGAVLALSVCFPSVRIRRPALWQWRLPFPSVLRLSST